MIGGGEAAHVRADLGKDDLRGGRPGPGDGVQLLGQGPRTDRGGLVPGACAAWRGDLLQRPDDQPVEFVDLCGQVVDGGQQHPQQPGVVVFELPGQDATLPKRAPAGSPAPSMRSHRDPDAAAQHG
ncbi:hypothetical protein ACH4ND_32330 [Streptomyces sp. NPDC017179]|uniref:hypothetical protein n=1 Tax=Streptomyces sp. NPDC017179 TaxID=3364979 RepID=UPI003789FAAA